MAFFFWNSVTCSFVGSFVCHSGGNAGGWSERCRSRQALSASDIFPVAAWTNAESSSERTGASLRFATGLLVLLLEEVDVIIALASAGASDLPLHPVKPKAMAPQAIATNTLLI